MNLCFEKLQRRNPTAKNWISFWKDLRKFVCLDTHWLTLLCIYCILRYMIQSVYLEMYLHLGEHLFQPSHIQICTKLRISQNRPFLSPLSYCRQNTVQFWVVYCSLNGLKGKQNYNYKFYFIIYGGNHLPP